MMRVTRHTSHVTRYTLRNDQPVHLLHKRQRLLKLLQPSQRHGTRHLTMHQRCQQSVLLADLLLQTLQQLLVVALAEVDDGALLLVHVKEEGGDWSEGVPVGGGR